MHRREFIKSSAAVAGLATMPGTPFLSPSQAKQKRDKLLNAYYFRAHMYTMVPRQVREDLQWMADLSTNIVSLAVLEQDLFAAVENIEIVCNEAEKLDMSVYAVASRWGGMFAGAPKVPSLFSVKNPQTWVLKKDGNPKISGVSGVISSVHYPETYNFFCESLAKMFELWPIKGVVWDEPKSYIKDYSPKAIEHLGEDAALTAHIQAVVDFHSSINTFLKENYADKVTNLFVPAHYSDVIVQMAAQTQQLDYYGCDGRPWYVSDAGTEEGEGKSLLGKEGGGRFLKAARKNNKKSLWLLENHNLATEDIPLMDKRLPEVVRQDVDQLIYYYYPRNVAEPNKAMKIIAKHVKKFK